MKRLQVIKKRVRKSTIFLLIFALMANAFAWFIYSDKVSGTITTGVKSWKINFKEDGADLINDIEFKVDWAYPGMETYEKEVSITNVGQLKASLKYEITYVRIFDEVYSNDTYSSDEIISILNSNYPFKIIFSIDNEALGTGQTTNFGFKLSWPYESGNDELDTTYGKKADDFNDNYPEQSQIEVKAVVTAIQSN